MQNPLDTYSATCKWVLRYLQGTTTNGLHIHYSPNNSLYGYTDADWASNADDRHSTGGCCIFYGDNLVSWSSKKQNVIAKSSTEFEYRALSTGAAELIWIQALLTELGITISTLPNRSILKLMPIPPFMFVQSILKLISTL